MWRLYILMCLSIPVVVTQNGKGILINMNNEVNTLLNDIGGNVTTKTLPSPVARTRSGKLVMRRTFDVETKDEQYVRFYKKIKNCREASESGIYQINLPRFKKMVQVRCESKFLKGGWIVIQRRLEGLEDFYRPWRDYKYGFGELEQEFWYGLEKVYALTNNYRYELIIVMENRDGSRGFAKYDHFVIGPETKQYKLERLGSFTGNIGNSLMYHLGQKFSTYDSKNDGNNFENCAMSFQGAWWYRNCYTSNLNGKYPTDFDTNCKKCIRWNTFLPDVPLKYIQMMIRTSEERSWDE